MFASMSKSKIKIIQFSIDIYTWKILILIFPFTFVIQNIRTLFLTHILSVLAYLVLCMCKLIHLIRFIFEMYVMHRNDYYFLCNFNSFIEFIKLLSALQLVSMLRKMEENQKCVFCFAYNTSESYFRAKMFPTIRTNVYAIRNPDSC